MIRLVTRAIGHLEFIFAKDVENVALFTKVKVKAVFALVPHADDRHGLTAVALHVLSYLLTGLDNELDVVGLDVVTSNLHFLNIVRSGEIAVLTHAKMLTVCTNKACPNDRPHITINAFVFVVSGQSVRKERQLNTAEVATFAKEILRFRGT